jgi:DsbC/DsbD-like thiol-disulfide interchange protein
MFIHGVVVVSLFLAAQAGGVPTRPRVQFEAAATVSSIAAGVPFDVVCTLVVPPKWHIYWKDPGRSGAATRVRVQAPSGFKIGPVRFPAPVVLKNPAGSINALDGRVHLAISMTPPKTIPVGSEVTLEVDADWLVCQEACFIGAGNGVVRIPVTSTPGPPTAAAQWIHHLPRPIQQRKDTITQVQSGPVLHISGPVDPAVPPTFLHQSRPGVELGNIDVRICDDRFVMQIPLRYDLGESLGQPPRISGLIRFGVERGDPAWEVDLPFTPEPHQDTEPPQ